MAHNQFPKLFLIVFVLASTLFAAKPATIQKPRVVLMPIKVSEEDRSLSGTMETALVEGLQDRYTVFSGERVQQKAREIFSKESKTAKAECDETKCMEDIAIAFQAELIAVANVTKRDGGYFLAISIQNIFDNKVVYSKSMPCKNSDSFEVIEKLKELARIQTVVNNTPIITTEPIKEKTIKPTVSNGSSTLEVGCTGTDIGAEVWIDDKLRGECPVGLKVPEGTLQLKVIKHIDAEHEALVEQEVRIFPDTVKKVDVKLQSRLTAEGIRLTQERERNELLAKQKAQIKAVDAGYVFLDKETNLMWQDNQNVDLAKMTLQGAIDYCKNLTLLDLDDWRLPTKNELLGVYAKKSSLKNIKDGIFQDCLYWTSSDHPSNHNQAAMVDFYRGALRGIPKNGYVIDALCVRDNK